MILLRSYWWVPVVLLLGGCSSGSLEVRDPGTPSSDQQTSADTWTVNNIRDAAINNAILTQHTLYPYHFNTGLDTLNELGERDLAALAANYRLRPGELNVRRGDADAELYAARLAVVSKRLQEEGVDPSRLKIVDAPAAGSGMGSDSVVKILLKSDKALSSDSADSSAGSSSNSGSAGSGVSASEDQK